MSNGSTGASNAYSRKVTFAGVSLDNLAFEEALDEIGRMIESDKGGFIVTPNASHISMLQRDWQMRRAYESAVLVLADGMPIIWASRLLGCPLKEKVSGSDLLPALCRRAAVKGYRVFFLGAAPGVAEEARDNLVREFPGLIVCGTHSPPLGFEKDAMSNRAVIDVVNIANPDLLFVALGTPKQEYWLAENASSLTAIVSIGVGASLDFAAGKVRRAPLWMQKTGLEWFWRLSLEPRRLWKRYAVDNSIFIYLLVKEMLHLKLTR